MTLLDLETARPAVDLPRPHRTRWQPLRAGLVDLFHYDYEEFHFRDGHLLLRGNNGTGKSKVLALLLPLLLDGELAPHRVEPDGDPHKRMEWNLLLGGRYPERTGYTWCEFGRLDGGTPQFTTIGIGLRAVQGRPVQSWFFVTDQRVGSDLFLVSPGRSPLRRDGLVEAVGSRGVVVEQAERYRRAVNEALFDLSPDRYDALLSLLISLRQPALSKRPDERRLSDALTEALPPLDPAVVTDLAEAFRSLEEERAALRDLDDASGTAASFLDLYSSYAQVLARRVAAGPRTAQSRYEDTGRKLGEARADSERASADEAALAEQQAANASESEQARRAEGVLRDSDAMKDAARLDRLREDLTRAEETARQATADLAHAQAALGRRQDDLATAAAELADAEAEVVAGRTAVTAAAADAGLGSLDVTPGRAAADDAVGRQRAAVLHVRRLVDDVDTARRAMQQATDAVERAAGERDAAADAVEVAHRTARDAGAALVAAGRQAVGALTTLRLADPEATLDRLALWVDTLAGPSPVDDDVAAAARDAVDRIARDDAALVQQGAVLDARELELDAERLHLESGADVAPAASLHRDLGSRGERAGAPLWRVVDFADDVPPADRAGLEAALEGSGLLDAWVTPEGRLVDADDAVLVGGAPATTPASRLLRPAVDRADPQAALLSDDAVHTVLAGIGLGDGDTWIHPTGRYRLGVLHGRWRKDAAAFVGAGARESTRRARLAALAAELAELGAARERVEGERRALDEQRTAVEADLASLPDDGPVRDAAAVVAAAEAARARADERLVSLGTRVEAARELVSTAEAVRDRDAAATGLPADAGGLAAVDDALRRLELALAAYWPAAASATRATGRHETAVRELELAEAAAGERQRRADTARLDVDGSRAAHTELEAASGAAVVELQRRLAEVVGRRRALREQEQLLRDDQLRLARAVGDAEGRVLALEAQLGTDAVDRDAQVERLRAFAATGLLRSALPDVDTPDAAQPWAARPAVALARAVEQSLTAVDDTDAVRERLTRQVQEALTVLGEVLSRGGDTLVPHFAEQGIVVTASWRGRALTVAELADGLAAEVAERERLLSAREREVLENHLVSDIAARLQELIRAAERQVGAMNRELAQRPTSTGMQLRFVWEPRPDAPTGLAQARERLLRQVSDAWSEDDRTAVGAFLQQQITDVRARDVAGTWSDHLREALDYRAWHAFKVERRQDGRWRPAAGPASGGERVLAATIPLFAAASSHYASAGSPHAPRLVLLDEAFAGVDDDSRGKCLGLLDIFDLDYVLTSEREWGCYPTVPGLAIAQLSRRDGIDAVLVTRWEWDGAARRRVELDLPPMTPPA
jgi:uncharacterized protein (TIGR02680 family)